MEKAINRHLQRALALSQSARCQDLAGRAYLRLGQVETACELLENALLLDPTFTPTQECLAMAKLELGSLSEAKALFQKVIASGQPVPQAEYELARLETQPSEENINRIWRILRRPNLSAADESFLRYAAGYRLEKLGKWDEAAQSFLLANSCKNQDESRDLKTEYAANKLIQSYSHGYFDRVKAIERCASQLPVFIVGMPRSGTTLVEQILSCHPEVFAAGELKTIEYLVASLTAECGDNFTYPELIDSLSAQTVKELGGSYVDEIRRRAEKFGSVKRIIDKMPTNHRHLGFIAAILPQARVIHVRRDPRDVFVSCIKQNLNWPFSDPDSLAYYLKQYEQLTSHWECVLPLRTFNLRYEELVTDSERCVADLLEFLDLTWNGACMNFPAASRAVRTPSKGQVRSPIYTSSIGNWKRYASCFAKYFGRDA